MSEEDKTKGNAGGNKDPLDQAISQIQEAGLKGLQAKLKTAAEEYAKAKEVLAGARTKVMDVIQEIKDAKVDYADLKSELKDAN